MEEMDVFKINDDKLFKHSVINGFRNTSLQLTISRNYCKFECNARYITFAYALGTLK